MSERDTALRALVEKWRQEADLLSDTLREYSPLERAVLREKQANYRKHADELAALLAESELDCSVDMVERLGLVASNLRALGQPELAGYVDDALYVMERPLVDAGLIASQRATFESENAAAEARISADPPASSVPFCPGECVGNYVNVITGERYPCEHQPASPAPAAVEGTFRRERIEAVIRAEEDGWRDLSPSNTVVLDALDNIRLHLGLPRPLIQKGPPDAD